MGHTSTGHKNETGGGGKGLECDKFNPQAITLQFNNWFNKIYESVDLAIAQQVIKVFHVDSWECGSQNWSSVFNAQFKKRRGYDLLPYLPVMAGIPVQSVQKSEQVLFDVRQTINDLITDIFYTTLKKLAAQKGCQFSAESVAPTMLSDGMLHYKKVDLPMGEFWNNSPTHDKPNDMLDAISAAHIYGKNIVQSEAFTTLRMNWAEHPGSLKTLGDRNFALGINKMVLHVFVHNPFMDKSPGVTLDGVGLYFQRNQTWFKQSKVWIDYLARCQAMLQLGKPVVDIAVFTGDELPRRSILPDRLVNTLPGIFGKERLDAEVKRLANEGQPLRQIPDGVMHSANMADPENWVNPLNGYAYDSFNPDALSMAKVVNGKIVLPSGMAYKILVLPANTKMNPGNIISIASTIKIIQLVKDGATVLMDTVYKNAFAANGLQIVFNQNKNEASIISIGKGRIVLTPYILSTFTALQLEKDIEVLSNNINPSTIAYTHRKLDNADVYFISNQKNETAFFELSLRVNGKIPELWNPVTGLFEDVHVWNIENGRTFLNLSLAENASSFIVFRTPTSAIKNLKRYPYPEIKPFQRLILGWHLQFIDDLNINAINLNSLQDLSKNVNSSIKYYAGTVLYQNSFTIEKINNVALHLSAVYNIATVKINGIDCGTLWTPPFQLDITKAVKEGKNTIEIAVTNTWHNRL
ncbi:MAG: DNA-binding protein, partial [Pedobacter sp.]|nr:DNA-binding protein [Chitinophagaceae bacterium]